MTGKTKKKHPQVWVCVTSRSFPSFFEKIFFGIFFLSPWHLQVFRVLPFSRCFSVELSSHGTHCWGRKIAVTGAKKKKFKTFLTILVNIRHLPFFRNNGLKKIFPPFFRPEKRDFLKTFLPPPHSEERAGGRDVFRKSRFSGLKNVGKIFVQIFFTEKLQISYIYQKSQKIWKRILLQWQLFFDLKNCHPEMTILPKNTSKIAKSRKLGNGRDLKKNCEKYFFEKSCEWPRSYPNSSLNMFFWVLTVSMVPN